MNSARSFRAVTAVLMVLAVACVPVAASLPAMPTHLSVATALVLHPDDVRGGAMTSVDTALTATEAASLVGITGVTGGLFAQNGYVNGYVRGFTWKDASLVTTKALASATYLFVDAVAAHDMLSFIVRGAERAGIDRMSLGAALGDESEGFQIDNDFQDRFGASISMTTTAVMFRHANALSLVSYTAPSEQDDPGYAIGLAHRQLDLQKAAEPAGVAVPELVAAVRVDPFTATHATAADLVLTVKDVPATMRVRNQGDLTAEQFAAGDPETGDMFAEHGFLSAYGRVFTRVSQFGKEATVIRTASAILADTRGAQKAFLDYADLARAVGARELGTAGAGDESRVYRLDDNEENSSSIEILIRHRNAVSTIEIEFPARFVNEALGLDLAARQVTHQLAELGMLKPRL